MLSDKMIVENIIRELYEKGRNKDAVAIQGMVNLKNLCIKENQRLASRVNALTLNSTTTGQDT